MKVLVCGSRIPDGPDKISVVNRTRRLVRDRLAQTPIGHLTTGGAPHVDEFARQWACETRTNHTVMYARWDLYGKRAGITRNLQMLDDNPGLVIAFWDGESRGTKHTIDQARRRGIPVEVISP